jgi:hypothetical protein
MAWQRSPAVIYEVVDGRAVLVDPDGVELITLNAVATLVWEALDGTREVPELATAIVDGLEGVTLPDLEHDIGEFLNEVEAAGLITPSVGA